MLICLETLTAEWKAITLQVVNDDTHLLLLIVAFFLLILLRLQQLGGLMRVIGTTLSLLTVVVLAISVIATVVANWKQVHEFGLNAAAECAPIDKPGTQ